MPEEADLWFLPGPSDDPDDLPPGAEARTEAGAGFGILPCDWARAEAAQAARLARVAGRLGALDDRLSRGPPGWRHRLALTEAERLCWWAGARIGQERLALWLSLRLAGVQQDAQALARAGWAVRRLSGGPAPEAGLAAFLGRQERPGDGFAARMEEWAEAIAAAEALHPFTRAAMGFHLWPMEEACGGSFGTAEWSAAPDAPDAPGAAGTAGGRGPRRRQSPRGGRLEAAVTAARVAAGDCSGGAVFVPLAMGGTGWLTGPGDAGARLERWLGGIEAAVLAAMRDIDRLEAWRARADAAVSALSGRTPGRLLQVFAAWPLVPAPLAGAETGASRAAVQRNLARMETQGLIREVTGQRRYQAWTARI